jgi:hypothetical protein
MASGHFLRVWPEDKQPGEDVERYYDEVIGATIVKLPKKRKAKKPVTPNKRLPRRSG